MDTGIFRPSWISGEFFVFTVIHVPSLIAFQIKRLQLAWNMPNNWFAILVTINIAEDQTDNVRIYFRTNKIQIHIWILMLCFYEIDI